MPAAVVARKPSARDLFLVPEASRRLLFLRHAHHVMPTLSLARARGWRARQGSKSLSRTPQGPRAVSIRPLRLSRQR